MVDKINKIEFSSIKKLGNGSLRVRAEDGIFDLSIIKSGLNEHQLQILDNNSDEVFLSSSTANNNFEEVEGLEATKFLTFFFDNKGELFFQSSNKTSYNIKFKVDILSKQIIYSCFLCNSSSNNFENRDKTKTEINEVHTNVESNTYIIKGKTPHSGDKNTDFIMDLVRNCKFELAISEINSLLNSSEDSDLKIRLKEIKAEVLNGTRKNSEAIKICDELLQENSKNHKALAEKALGLRGLSQLEAGEKLINEAISLHEDVRYYYIKAFILNCKGRKFNTQALNVINDALKIDSNYAPLVGLLGLISSEQSNFKEAITYFDKAILLSPNDYSIYIHKGLCYKHMKSLTNSKDCFIKAIELYPQSSVAYDNLGDYYYSNNIDIELALKNFKLAIEFGPDNTHALVSFAGALNKQKKKDEALALIEKALKINSDYAYAYYQKGAIYYDNEEYDLGCAAFSKAVDLQPNNTNFLNAYAHCLVESQEISEAIDLYEKVLDIDPDNEQATEGKENALSKL